MRDALMAELQREEIVKRIRQARKEAGLSQPEMADAIDVAPRTYQNYEYDRVPWGLIGRIASVTGKSSEWLLHGDSADLLGGFKADTLTAQLERIETDVSSIRTLLEQVATQQAEARAREEFLTWLAQDVRALLPPSEEAGE